MNLMMWKRERCISMDVSSGNFLNVMHRCPVRPARQLQGCTHYRCRDPALFPPDDHGDGREQRVGQSDEPGGIGLRPDRGWCGHHCREQRRTSRGATAPGGPTAHLGRAAH